MSLTPVETKQILEETIFYFQKPDDINREVALYQVCCGGLKPQIFREACVRAIKYKGKWRIEPSSVWNHAKEVMKEGQATGGEDEKPKPPDPAEVDAWCAREVDRISPKGCKALIKQIDAGETFLQKMGLNWNSRIIQKLLLKAQDAPPDEPEKAPEPEKEALPAKAIGEVIEDSGWTEFKA